MDDFLDDYIKNKQKIIVLLSDKELIEQYKMLRNSCPVAQAMNYHQLELQMVLDELRKRGLVK